MRWNRKLPLLLSLVLVSLHGGCERPSHADVADERPLVVASIYPIGDLIRTLVGEDARVQVLLPAGASPATFDVTPRQVSGLRSTDLFVMVGAGLDEWVSDLPGTASESVQVIRLAQGMDLLADAEREGERAAGHEGRSHEADEHDHAQDTGNPHIWLDPILVRDQVLPKLLEALSEVLPESMMELEARGRELAASLTALDQEVREALRPLEQRAFIVTHSAWSYFALRYDLIEAGVVHLHPGQDPSARDVAHLLDVARNRGLACVFTEPQLGETAVQAIASELELPTCLLDPLGGPGLEDRQDYFSLLRFNVRQLVDGLERGQA